MTVKRSVTAGLALGIAALVGGCFYAAPNVPICAASYEGGCVPRPPGSVVILPTSPATANPAAVPLGDPSTFANVDDKQCRSYGLTFGSRDYADCRIRLSAQHRGLDQNIGTTPSGPATQ